MSTDQSIFFDTLSSILGDEYLVSKSLNRPVSDSDIFFKKDYQEFQLPNNINNCINNTLVKLKSNQVQNGSLARHIDGLIIDHPVFGSRIIEFDEEQHFNIFRELTVNYLKSEFDCYYFDDILNECKSFDVQKKMLNKHRLSGIDIDDSKNMETFIKKISERPNISDNGYVEPKKQFNYFGGRIAQRAYYDMLRDIAHLSPQNIGFSSSIRILKTKIERVEDCSFNKIPKQRLDIIIRKEISNYGNKK